MSDLEKQYPYYAAAVAENSEYQYILDVMAKAMAHIAVVEAQSIDDSKKIIDTVAQRLRMSTDDVMAASQSTVQLACKQRAEGNIDIEDLFDNRSDLKEVDEHTMPRHCIPEDYWLHYARVVGMPIDDILPIYLEAFQRESYFNEGVGVVSFECCI